MRITTEFLGVTLSENVGRINDEDDEVKLNTLTHFKRLNTPSTAYTLISLF